MYTELVKKCREYLYLPEVIHGISEFHDYTQNSPNLYFYVSQKKKTFIPTEYFELAVIFLGLSDLLSANYYTQTDSPWGGAVIYRLIPKDINTETLLKQFEVFINSLEERTVNPEVQDGIIKIFSRYPILSFHTLRGKLTEQSILFADKPEYIEDYTDLNLYLINLVFEGKLKRVINAEDGVFLDFYLYEPGLPKEYFD